MPRSMRSDFSAEYLRSILNYDSETGFFTWKIRSDAEDRWNTKHAGNRAGGPCTFGHIQITINNVLYLAHRLAWLYIVGEWPLHEIDHKDLNPANNTWSNLRTAENGQNQRNVGPLSSNAYGLKSVYKRKASENRRKPWVAHIRIDGRQKTLGYYHTAEEAQIVYARAAQHYYGEFARITNSVHPLGSGGVI